jgi:N-ethylmaleimide reductase
MHAGRISDPSLLPGSATPLAPSAIRPNGSTYTDARPRPQVTPRALSSTEIASIVERFAAAARRAVDAGFDGVELHAGAGYLPMQFLSSSTNERSDAYGGGPQQRVRFTVELLEAITAAIGADRTGLKLTPEMAFNDIHDADPIATYGALMRAIRPLHLAFVEMAPGAHAQAWHERLRPLSRSAWFAGVGFDPARARQWVEGGHADAVLFGQAFIANPDLPARIGSGAPLARADTATFYSGGARGYTDYPALEAAAAVAA